MAMVDNPHEPTVFQNNLQSFHIKWPSNSFLGTMLKPYIRIDLGSRHFFGEEGGNTNLVIQIH